MRADRRGLVVLSDVHFPGWKATVDGREVPIERVDYLLRGVAVGPGEHRDRAHLRAVELAAGWIVSLLAALGAARPPPLWKSARRWRSSSAR